MKFFPRRSSVLIKYNHIIHTISQDYTWDNVYLYDKDFCIHMSHHPQCNWSVILQQVWSLKDKCSANASFNWSNNSPGNQDFQSSENHGKINKPCRRYNKGRCPFGSDCHYEHHCSYCFKFGHSVLSCRKLQADKDRGERKGDFKKGGQHHSQRDNKNSNGQPKASDNSHRH